MVYIDYQRDGGGGRLRSSSKVVEEVEFEVGDLQCAVYRVPGAGLSGGGWEREGRGGEGRRGERGEERRGEGLAEVVYAFWRDRFFLKKHLLGVCIEMKLHLFLLLMSFILFLGNSFFFLSICTLFSVSYVQLIMRL